MKFNYRTIINGVLFEPGTYTSDEIIEKISVLKKIDKSEVRKRLEQQNLIETLPETKGIKAEKINIEKPTTRKKKA